MKAPEGIGIRKYRKEMEKVLKPDRYEHSIGVAYTSAALAMRFGADVQKALIAGILHDCAKCLTHEEQLKICRKQGLPVTDAERKNLKLLHARVGAYLAEKEYGVTDPEILSAIRWHTTGRPGMTKLDKIVFLADIIEPNRRMFPEMTEIRDRIFADLDEGLKLTLSYLLEYLQKSGEEIDPTTEETWAYYRDGQDSAGNGS